MGRYYKEKGKEGDDWLKSYAKDNKMTKSELLEAFKKQKIDNEIQTIADTEGVSEEVAARLRNETLLTTKSQTDAETAKSQKWVDDNWSEFVEKFPDVKDVSEDVVALFQSGDVSLVDAYTDSIKDSTIENMTKELAELKEKLGITTKNNDNAEASTGSVTGNGAVKSELTDESISKMSNKERMARWPEIKKVLGMK